VVTENAIEDRQQAFAADLLRDLPGVALNRTSTNGSVTQVRVRGAEANHLLVVIDGVEVNDPAGGDEFNFGSLTSYDIASIELVRGPQSALWGSDAMAGVLNITTRSATEPLGASGFFQGGSFGTRSGGGHLSAASGKGDLRLSASRFETDGVSAAASGNEKDGYDNTTLGLNGRYNFTDVFGLGFSSRYNKGTIEYDGSVGADGLPVDSDDETDREELILSIDAALRLLNGRWKNSLRATYLETDNETVGGFDSNYAATKHGYYFQSTLFLGARERMDRHRLTFGVDYEDEDYKQRTAFADQDQNLDNTGFVLEYFTRTTDALTLSASVRHDDNSEFEDVTTYRGTASYRIAFTGTRIRSSVGTGQKRPTFTERFGFSQDFFVGNPDLKPEKNEGFDLGIEQQLAGGRFRIGGTYFNEQLKDEIVLAGFPSTPVNLAGGSKREGVELEFSGELAGALTLTANYTYTDSKQPDAAADADVREIRRPRNQAAVNLNHRFHDGRGNVNLNVSYTGSQTDTVFVFPANRVVTLDAYTLVNVTGEYALTPWLTLFARAENLFDEKQVDVAGHRNPGVGFYGGFRVGAGR
jgi:vitamin B12 transporter